MIAFEKFTMVFLFTVLIGLGYMTWVALGDRASCVQTAMSQNYPADQIKKICR